MPGNSGGSATYTQEIEVRPVMIDGLSYDGSQDATLTWTIGQFFKESPMLSAGAIGVTYESSTPLPSGILIDPTTGEISGIPSELFLEHAKYDISASNAEGSDSCQVMTFLILSVSYSFQCYMLGTLQSDC